MCTPERVCTSNSTTPKGSISRRSMSGSASWSKATTGASNFNRRPPSELGDDLETVIHERDSKGTASMRTLATISLAAVSTTVAFPAIAALRQVTGTLLFEDQDPDGPSLGTKPIRNVSVSVKVGSSTVGTATTGSTGTFST